MRRRADAALDEALLGNVIGGVLLVAALSHVQVSAGGVAPPRVGSQLSTLNSPTAGSLPAIPDIRTRLRTLNPQPLLPPPVLLLRVLFVIFAAFLGATIGEVVVDSTTTGIAAGLVFGFCVVLVDLLLKGFSLRLFSSATFGLLLGLIAARLLLSSQILRPASEDIQWIAGLAVYATFAYLGMMLAFRSSRDEFSLIIPYVRFRRTAVQDAPLLIDTNIVIDGRIATLCATGFLSGTLVIPRFVLDELQRLADSADPQKRERGRTGLERLQSMQRDPALSVTIHESTGDPALPVDARLIQLAQLLQARLLTNDSALCQVARLQAVTALNLHDLAQALRPSLDTGARLDLHLVKEGRDPHQAVGYLPDGTMIVVNHARPRLGQTVPIIIGSALQTSAGRLLFAELA